MTTAVFEKRLRALEEEVKELKRESIKRPVFRTEKRLPKGVLAGLRDMKAGRVLGSFSSGKAMKRAFEK